MASLKYYDDAKPGKKRKTTEDERAKKKKNNTNRSDRNVNSMKNGAKIESG